MLETYTDLGRQISLRHALRKPQAGDPSPDCDVDGVGTVFGGGKHLTFDCSSDLLYNRRVQGATPLRLRPRLGSPDEPMGEISIATCTPGWSYQAYIRVWRIRNYSNDPVRYASSDWQDRTLVWLGSRDRRFLLSRSAHQTKLRHCLQRTGGHQ